MLTGKEGGGKSTLAIQIGSWIDPNFTLDNVCFTQEDYIRRLREVKRGACLVIDEGGVTLFSREAMGGINVLMVKIFMLQRQKNVSVILCCPSFWDIDTYLRRHRVNTMIRVYKQGHYMGYLLKAINIINDIGYRKRPLTQIKLPSESFWHGTFRKGFPKSVNRDAYLKKKDTHLEKFLESIEEDIQKAQETIKKRRRPTKSLEKTGLKGDLDV